MAIFKCKMCGGSLDINNNETVATCEYCGTQQTLVKSKDEVVQNLYNRANTLRLNCEFDRAEQTYEKIIELDVTESEAYWGLILCKYGIEYVDDTLSKKRIPTCHRASYDAVLTDNNYLSAIEHATREQKIIYELEARNIEEIQKNILDIVEKETPFDVFISYKETDVNGNRTIDSVIANDIYYQLTQEGYKVFYAPITLEDKLGEAYEPYIFAALNSAKVMLVVGTNPEYFNAVWVKNEWNRYLKLLKNDRSRLLIPCYKDMDAYDLPDEFAHLQSQDMSKIGFINDVVRGIKKVIVKESSIAELQKTVVDPVKIKSEPHVTVKKPVLEKSKKKITIIAMLAFFVLITLTLVISKPNFFSGLNSKDTSTGESYIFSDLIDKDKLDRDVTNYQQTVVREILDEYKTTSFEGTVANGDTLNIDYVGKMNGEMFEGGSEQGCMITIGSGEFIVGFEESLIGVKVGQTCTFSLSFPDDYAISEVAGKICTWEVKINCIYRYPELTDEIVAKKAGIRGCKTVDEYLSCLRKEAIRYLVWKEYYLSNDVKEYSGDYYINYENQMSYIGEYPLGYTYVDDVMDQYFFEFDNERSTLLIYQTVEALGIEITQRDYDQYLAEKTLKEYIPINGWDADNNQDYIDKLIYQLKIIDMICEKNNISFE